MDTLHNNDDHLLDLLVDDELDETQRRDVLNWCQREPDGWRRCALAFLEAQSWRRELGGLVRGARLPEPTAEAHPAPVRVSPAPVEPARRFNARWSVQSFFVPLAMAACFLLAFGLGLAMRRGLPGTGRPSSTLAHDEQLAAMAKSAPSSAADAGSPTLASMPQSPEPLGDMRLVVGGVGGVPEEIQLPVYDARSLVGDFASDQPSAVPPDIERLLERLGHQVKQRRELMGVPLGDGRNVIVPVDQIEVTPVTNHYQ